MAYDLMVFFAVVGTAPSQVTSADVLGCVTAQHTGTSVRVVLERDGQANGTYDPAPHPTGSAAGLRILGKATIITTATIPYNDRQGGRIIERPA